MSDAPPQMPDELLRVLGLATQVLNEQNTDYALIGGLAVAVRGPIRATRDIDLLLTVPQVNLPGLLESLRGQGFRLDVLKAIAAWNKHHLLDIGYGDVRLDCLSAVLPLFRRILDRSRWEHLGAHSVRVADAEGLLVLKLVAFRPRDQEDIRGILAANRAALDLDWVRNEWSQVADAGDPRTQQFEEFVREFYELS
jgi:hypothetical protein